MLSDITYIDESFLCMRFIRQFITMPFKVDKKHAQCTWDQRKINNRKNKNKPIHKRAHCTHSCYDEIENS